MRVSHASIHRYVCVDEDGCFTSDGKMDEWMDGWMDGWMDVNRWMDGWMDGCE